MKIERDKWYVTRDGEKVRVVCVDAPGDWPVVAIDADGSVMTYLASGHFNASKDGPIESDEDLISEHREPARVWVNEYPDGEYYAYASADDAKDAAGSFATGSFATGSFATRIAVEFVEVVNGRDDG